MFDDNDNEFMVVRKKKIWGFIEEEKIVWFYRSVNTVKVIFHFSNL